MTRDFHIGDILSITTGCLVSPRHIDGIYDILNFMTGESIYTHQIVRAMKACAPSLIGQYPTLAAVDVSSVHDPASAEAFVAEQIAVFGETLPVEPLLAGAYEAMDPLAELHAMMPKDRVIVVRP